MAAPRTGVGLGLAEPSPVQLIRTTCGLACKPPVRCKVVRPPQVGRVVLEEHLRDELASTANAGLLEDRLQVVLDRVRREPKRLGYLVRGEALDHAAHDVALSFRHPVGVCDQRRDLGWTQAQR